DLRGPGKGSMVLCRHMSWSVECLARNGFERVEPAGCVLIDQLIVAIEELLEATLPGVVDQQHETRPSSLQFGYEPGVAHLPGPEPLEGENRQPRGNRDAGMEGIDGLFGEHELCEGFEPLDFLERAAVVELGHRPDAACLEVKTRAESGESA